MVSEPEDMVSYGFLITHFNFLFLHKLSLETNNLYFRKAFRSLCSCRVKRF